MLDPSIYDDAEIYMRLVKEEIVSETPECEEDLMLKNTRLYLLERKLKNQESSRKIVDRRASKGRKLRYIQHAKIVNFMNPLENMFQLDNRQEIINSVSGIMKTMENESLNKNQLKQ